MLDQQKGTESVDLESLECMGGVDLGGRLLWVQNTRDREAEMEVVTVLRK